MPFREKANKLMGRSGRDTPPPEDLNSTAEAREDPAPEEGQEDLDLSSSTSSSKRKSLKVLSKSVLTSLKSRIPTHMVLPSDLALGDHIYFVNMGGLFSHHAVVVEIQPADPPEKGIFVAEFNPPRGEGCTDHITVKAALNPVELSNLINSARAQLTCLADVPYGEEKDLEVRRVTYGASKSELRSSRSGSCHEMESDPPDVVVRRALEAVEEGVGKYSLADNNCEHFAVFCKTGILHSSQIERFPSFAPDLMNRGAERLEQLASKCTTMSGSVTTQASSSTSTMGTVTAYEEDPDFHLLASNLAPEPTRETEDPKPATEISAGQAGAPGKPEGEAKGEEKTEKAQSVEAPIPNSVNA